MTLLELPEDVLSVIWEFLDWKTRFAFLRVSKASYTLFFNINSGFMKLFFRDFYVGLDRNQFYPLISESKKCNKYFFDHVAAFYVLTKFSLFYQDKFSLSIFYHAIVNVNNLLQTDFFLHVRAILDSSDTFLYGTSQTENQYLSSKCYRQLEILAQFCAAHYGVKGVHTAVRFYQNSAKFVRHSLSSLLFMHGCLKRLKLDWRAKRSLIMTLNTAFSPPGSRKTKRSTWLTTDIQRLCAHTKFSMSKKKILPLLRVRSSGRRGGRIFHPPSMPTDPVISSAKKSELPALGRGSLFATKLPPLCESSSETCKPTSQEKNKRPPWRP